MQKSNPLFVKPVKFTARIEKKIRRHVKPARVMIVHDDTDVFRGGDAAEANIGVWEAIAPIEETLRWLGHTVARAHIKTIPDLVRQIRRFRPALVFHLAETVFGDTRGEGRLAGLLEDLGQPSTSVSSEALFLCRDKFRTKTVLDGYGIPTPAYAISPDGRCPPDLPPRPWIVKPSLEDGSIGIDRNVVIKSKAELRSAVSGQFDRFRQPILIESFVRGAEYAFVMVGNTEMPIGEIDFSRLPEHLPPLISYTTKWKYASVYCRMTRTHCPARLSKRKRSKIRAIARRTMAALRLDGYAKIDFRMDLRGRPYVLEVNPNPDISPNSSLAEMAKVLGWGYPGLIQKIVEYSLARSKNLPG
ncbi:ATP-grasp domain-containing protein [bacterium]|nr:ATP-grasp domain-containing protein [bacterium]